MPHLIKTFKIKPRDFVKAGEVSIRIQGLLKTIGFDADLIRSVSVCAYESEMNVVMHGGEGSLFLIIDPDQIILEVKDDGAGIEDVDLALREGFSTASQEFREMGFGAGMGLPNIKKHADVFEIRSELGKGTNLRMCFKTDRSGK